MQTDIGILSSENFKFLVDLKVLNPEGGILNRSYRIGDADVYYWSMFTGIMNDVEQNCSAVRSTPSTDDKITLLREGVCSVRFGGRSHNGLSERVTYDYKFKDGVSDLASLYLSAKERRLKKSGGKAKPSKGGLSW